MTNVNSNANAKTRRIAALVPMRHQSERVKEKNFRPFGGKPLYHHILSNLICCPEISVVAIDTDSPFIMEDARANFPSVVLLERPLNLRGGMVPMNDVLLHDVTMVDADFYLQTHSTNPLLQTSTIRAAIERFLGEFPAHDSLFSVTRLQARLWDEKGQPLNHDPTVLLRTQDLPPVYEENSNLYIFTRQTLEQRRNRLGARPLMFEVDRLEAWDIDEEVDFRIAETLFLASQARKA
jgi:CMP-N-acetylneuraminic acid synthetase